MYVCNGSRWSPMRHPQSNLSIYCNIDFYIYFEKRIIIQTCKIVIGISKYLFEPQYVRMCLCWVCSFKLNQLSLASYICVWVSVTVVCVYVVCMCVIDRQPYAYIQVARNSYLLSVVMQYDLCEQNNTSLLQFS